VRTQSPLPEPGSPDTRTDRFYYDGVRRVVEIQTGLRFVVQPL